MWKTLWRRIGIAYVVLALAPLAVFAVAFPVVEGWRWFADKTDWYTRDAMTAPERAADLAKKGLVEQLVTFPDAPVGVRKNPQTDAFDLYVIGVSQTTLPDEITPQGLFAQGLPLRDQNSVKLSYVSNPVIGRFNNLVLYEPKTAKLTPIFTQRLAVSTFQYAVGPEFEVVVALAGDQDTDKDGKLSLLDRQDVYVFSLKDQTLHKVEGLVGSATKTSEIAGHPFVLVHTSLEADKANLSKETAIAIAAAERMFRVDLVTYKAEPVIPAELLDKLQKTLDGRSNATQPK